MKIDEISTHIKMSIGMTGLLLSALAVLAAAHPASVLATTDATVVHTETQAKLMRVESLDDHCKERVCRGFDFANVNEVAFFDIKAEVHINNSSTYDVISPVEHYSLTFENSSFAHFPLHLFYTYDIRELDMRNCSVRLVTWENFLMAGNLRILLLSNNKINRIDYMTFNYASELQYLFLDSNRIHTLHSESFQVLSKLKYLDLKNNRLMVLPSGIFDSLVSLQELDLSRNRFRVLDNELLVHNTNLMTIQLEENKLHEVGEYAFKNQQNLMLIDLSGNSNLNTLVMNLQTRFLVAANCSLNRVNIYGAVANVDMRNNHILELYFSQPEMLETLNLRNNALEQIASLTRVTNLKHLDIGDNPNMHTLPEPWLTDSLERLDLSNTSLMRLQLPPQSHLRVLNISNNKISEISPSIFRTLESLSAFYIHANDWNCYNLHVLMNLIIKPRQMIYTRDTFDPDFPGEYIDGIACMYKLPEQSGEVDVNENVAADNMISESMNIPAQLRASEDSAAESANTFPSTGNSDVDSMRRELKAIVGFYEQKFDQIFNMIGDLNARLRNFEELNATFWQHVTITT